MTFAHPLLLLLLAAPLAWVVYSWRAYRRQGNGRVAMLVLKLLSLAAVLVALSEPSMTLPETRTAEVILLDTSASLTAADLDHASELARSIEAHKGRNWVRVVPFAAAPRPLRPDETAAGLHLRPVSDASTGATDLEAALTGSMAAVPSGYLPRFLLLSDGNENQGSAVRAIAQLQRLSIPVDTIPLGSDTASGLRIESVSLPEEAFSAEQIPIDLVLRSSRPAIATVDLSGEGKLLGRQTIDLKSGLNSVHLNARIKSTGIVSIAGGIGAGQAGSARFEQAIKLRRGRVLYLSGDPPGTDANLIAAFDQANFEVLRDPAQIDRDLSTLQLVVLNNLDLGTLSADRKTRLEKYVEDGGGLLLIGGEHQVYKEDQQMDALDRALPAKLAPPDTPKGTCVALIIDKSSSMEGRKIELARVSAIGVVDHLKPTDTIGVLMFDNSYQWAVPMRHAEDKPLIKRLISGITPDGGTQIAPALTEAYHRVLPSTATFKHIVLLTDGISEEGDSIDLAKEAAQHDVTISTVGLGQDVNRTYLEKVASTSGGRSYFLNEPVGLEQILLKDVETYTGSTAVEKPLTPIVSRPSDVLDGVDMRNAPPLRGYVRFIAKPGADTVLEVDPTKKNPLYVSWQYGLGRAAVFTSDAKSRWAAAWVNWPGFDKFWINVSRDLLMHSSPSKATAEYDPSDGDLRVHYQLAGDTPEPRAIPAIYVLGPRGFRKPVEVTRTARGLYDGRLHIGPLTGLFRIRPAADSVAFPEVGLYRQQPEFDDHGVNSSLLKAISSFTGGTFNPPLDDIFNAGGRRNSTVWQLWPAFLALAIALQIAELVTRKWSGILSRFRRQ